MKLLLMFVVMGALLTQANGFPSLKIIANKLVGGDRLVMYENCGQSYVLAFWTPSSMLASCQVLTPSPNTLSDYTQICGWTGSISNQCQYFVCKIPDVSPTSIFYVTSSWPITCNVGTDRAAFAFGSLIPDDCCP